MSRILTLIILLVFVYMGASLIAGMFFGWLLADRRHTATLREIQSDWYQKGKEHARRETRVGTSRIDYGGDFTVTQGSFVIDNTLPCEPEDVTVEWTIRPGVPVSEELSPPTPWNRKTHWWWDRGQGGRFIPTTANTGTPIADPLLPAPNPDDRHGWLAPPTKPCDPLRYRDGWWEAES